ncbi:heptaprenylglyceryl phosphate synthase [Tuberibacillus sp. Marseille-P3662]|uniref:heptaprenylglyceryl phosphate synthase n=1 Tax=Tuberibacillus sp. Marseille-P3662 TaxID=1965358 RepID=UPI000A1C8905|nr:heptaprenylglyceryl phosphate synthase [Tuberibacillus sp. Marseille-P3662]
MHLYKEWQHVFKLDPNKDLTDEALEEICESGTDAVIVGGTDGVTLDNTLYLLRRIRQYALDCALELSNVEAVTPGFDLYMIPMVLNAQQTEWIVGKHHEAVKTFGETMDWDEVTMEGYCVLNPNSKVAERTAAQTDQTIDDVKAYAMMAENMLHLPVFYLEYSGTYGDVETVQAAGSVLHQTQLLYGGGIDSKEKAAEIAHYADTVIVGDVIYHDLKTALKTVHAVKKVKNNS